MSYQRVTRRHVLGSAGLAAGGFLLGSTARPEIARAASDDKEFKIGAVLELSGADLVYLALPEEDGRRLTIAYAEGCGAEAARGLVLPGNRSLSAKALASGHLVACADFAADARAAPAARAAMSQIGPAMLCPLGNRRGVLFLGRERGGPPFPEADTAFTTAFAAQAGVALELAVTRAEAERLSVYEDRDRIARDLHDLVIQRLYATGMSLEGTMPLIAKPEVANRISSAVDAMDETIKEIRGAIFALQTRDTGAQQDLRAEIVGLVEQMTPMLGFGPSLRLGAGLRAEIPGDTAEQALAALREALSNVARHAGASTADVVVDVDDSGDLYVLVADNGDDVRENGRAPGPVHNPARRQEGGGRPRVEPAAPGACPAPAGPEGRHPSRAPSRATAPKSRPSPGGVRTSRMVGPNVRATVTQCGLAGSSGERLEQQVGVLLEHPDGVDQVVGDGEQLDDVDGGRAAGGGGLPGLGRHLDHAVAAPHDPRLADRARPVPGELGAHLGHAVGPVVPAAVGQRRRLLDAEVRVQQGVRPVAVTGPEPPGQLLHHVDRAVHPMHLLLDGRARSRK